MQKLAKVIRVATVAPIAAAIMLTIIYVMSPEQFKNINHYLISVLTLTVFPLLAYPLSLFFKKEHRRSYQRSLAIDLSVAGYIAGFIFSIAAGSPASEKIIYLTYLLSGASIAIFSFLVKKKSSGHACGVSGPVAMLMYCINPLFSLGYILLAPVFWASLKMKRHTLPQLISGSLIPVFSMFVSVLIFRL